MRSSRYRGYPWLGPPPHLPRHTSRRMIIDTMLNLIRARLFVTRWCKSLNHKVRTLVANDPSQRPRVLASQCRRSLTYEVTRQKTVSAARTRYGDGRRRFFEMSFAVAHLRCRQAHSLPRQHERVMKSLKDNRRWHVDLVIGILTVTSQVRAAQICEHSTREYWSTTSNRCDVCAHFVSLKYALHGSSRPPRASEQTPASN